MILLLHLALFLARNRLWLLPGFVILLLLVPSMQGRRRLVLQTLIVAFGLGNFLSSPLLRGWLLYRLGETATAQVVSTYETSTQVNDHDVVGYNVLIRDRRGDTFASRFEDDEVNTYPPSDFSYPQIGESFGVRFLPGFPRDVIMLSECRAAAAHVDDFGKLPDHSAFEWALRAAHGRRPGPGRKWKRQPCPDWP